jgi:hypothetical protein
MVGLAQNERYDLEYSAFRENYPHDYYYFPGNFDIHFVLVVVVLVL